jgi:hypothetical protein
MQAQADDSKMRLEYGEAADEDSLSDADSSSSSSASSSEDNNENAHAGTEVDAQQHALHLCSQRPHGRGRGLVSAELYGRRQVFAGPIFVPLRGRSST